MTSTLIACILFTSQTVYVVRVVDATHTLIALYYSKRYDTSIGNRTSYNHIYIFIFSLLEAFILYIHSIELVLLTVLHVQ